MSCPQCSTKIPTPSCQSGLALSSEKKRRRCDETRDHLNRPDRRIPAGRCRHREHAGQALGAKPSQPLLRDGCRIQGQQRPARLACLQGRDAVSVNIRLYRGQPVPYFEFSDSELRQAIQAARESIQALALLDTKRAEWSIGVLRDNIKTMRRVMGGTSV